VKSRERFLSQCVRPAALMMPEPPRGADGGSGGGSGRSASTVGSAEPGAPGARSARSSAPEADWADAPLMPEAALGPLRPPPGSVMPGSARGGLALGAGPLVSPPPPVAAAAAAGAAQHQVFMPLGFRERSCTLVVKEAGGSGGSVSSLGSLLARTGRGDCRPCLVPSCELVRLGLLVRSTLHDGPGGGGSGFWGSAGVAAVCSALRHTPPLGGSSAGGSAAAAAAARAQAVAVAGAGGAGGGTVPMAVMPVGYQEMQCIVLVGLDSGHDDGGAARLPPWWVLLRREAGRVGFRRQPCAWQPTLLCCSAARGSIITKPGRLPSLTFRHFPRRLVSTPPLSSSGGHASGPSHTAALAAAAPDALAAAAAAGGVALFQEVHCVLLVRAGSIRIWGGNGAGPMPVGAATAAAAAAGERPGVTGGHGRAPRASGGFGGAPRVAGRRRSSASIVEGMRVAAPALAPPAPSAVAAAAAASGSPDAALVSPALAFPGHWACGADTAGGGGAAAGPAGDAAAAALAAAQPPLASLGLRESWVSLLVREPAVSLSSDPHVSGLLPEFVEVRVTLLVAAEP
jgi:hypothetical protein